MNTSYPSERAPDLEGPDYVALVIEWDDDEDVTFVSAVESLDSGEPERTQIRPIVRTVASIVGLLGVLALASWGLHRLTA
jgi:hypothetical protein